MPARNAEKQYVRNCYYHLYNRGVEKRDIFIDDQDRGVFLSYLKEYLLPKGEALLHQKLADPKTSPIDKAKILKALRMNNFSSEIQLLAYALMPNHFHLLVHQKSALTIDTFMNSLGTRYSMYFNRKYKRVGPLYQGVYKAVPIVSEEQLLHVSRYIHRNPLSLQGVALKMLSNQPTSYAEYLGMRNTLLIHAAEILSYLSKTIPFMNYSAFVNETDELEVIKDVVIDLDR